MTPDRWQQINELYHNALELDPNQQAKFLSQACAGDSQLFHEVESLIASHDQAGSFISEPALKLAGRILAKDQAASFVGQRFSHYWIESVLGVGGMGMVYLAEDLILDRKLALKLLPAFFTNDKERLRRFEQEARAASALNHPNILTIYEIGKVDGHHYMATEFIDGETLREHIVRGPMTLEESLDVATQVASALAAAHAAGIIHRDIKPENVMVRSDGFVKVLDFGLAKLVPRYTSIRMADASAKSIVETNPGLVMGTVHYMSPEQARGKDVDATTDIWSLGVVLYEMVTGRAPFAGETPSHVIVSILETQPSPLTHKNGIPDQLGPIVDKALRKDREERYQTARELARDLKNLKQELEVEARLNRPHTVDGVTSESLTANHFGERAVKPVRQSAEHPVDITKKPSASSAKHRIGDHRRGLVLTATVILMLLAVVSYKFYLNRQAQRLVTSGDPIASLAVLPFVNENGDPNTEYLAEGISDSVINSLSRLPKLKVISFNAVLRFRGTSLDPQKVGSDLNVRAVLLGRMTQRGDDLAISTELVDVQDNSRLWGEQYIRKQSDILSVQEEIARKISEALRLRLSGEEKQQLEKRYTQNTEAYLLYSLGRYYSNKTTKEGWEKGIQYYEKAINTDPKYALAYVGLSSCFKDLHTRGLWKPEEAMRKQEWAAVKAVELDDTLSEAHVALSEVRLAWSQAGAEKECKRALELDPNSVDANQRYALYLVYHARSAEALLYAKRADELDQTRSARPGVLGLVYFLTRQYDAAIDEYLKAIRMSPNFAQTHFFLGEAYVAKGMYKEGVAELQKAVKLDGTPERWDRYPVLAYAYGVSGQRDEALKILAEQKRLAMQRYIGAYNFAIIYIGLDDKDRAFEYLNKAFEDGMPLLQVPSRPLFDSLRSDPRYTQLLQRIYRTQ